MIRDKGLRYEEKQGQRAGLFASVCRRSNPRLQRVTRESDDHCAL